MENLTINQGIKFTAGDGTGVIGTANPSGSQGISKTAGHTGFYIQSSVDYTLYFYDGSSWSAHQSIDVSDANYAGGFVFAWEDNTAAYIKTADSSHVVYVFARNTDLKVDSTPNDGNQSFDSIVDGTGSLSITSINAQNYYTEALSVANDGTVTFDRTDNNNAYQLKFSGNGITIGSNGSDTITLTGADEFTTPLTTDGDLFIQSGGADSRLGIGSDGQYLSVSSGAPAWVDFAGSPWSSETSPTRIALTGSGKLAEIGDNNQTWNGTPVNGFLVIGGANTLKSIQRGLVVGYGNNIGSVNYAASIFAAGMSNIIYDGDANSAIGKGNRTGYGSANFVAGDGNYAYGNRNIALGYNNRIGQTSATVDSSVGIGTNVQPNADNQILIGQSIATSASWATAPGIYFGVGLARANAGFFRDPGAATASAVNFVLGGASAMRTDTYGMIKTGAGSGMFYLHNEPSDIRIVEPSTDLPHGIAMWAKNRTGSNQLGLIVKAENGGMSWIGDRIGVNVTSTGDANAALSSTIDASLHVFGEGSTSATSSFKIDNSAGTTLFEVKDDGTVQANGGGLLGYHSSGALELMTSSSASIQNTINGSIYNGTVLVAGYLNNIAAGARAALISGYYHDIDKYVDRANIFGNANKVHASTDTSHSSYASLGLKDGATIIGSGNYGNGAGIQVIGATNEVWGSNTAGTISMTLGNTNKIGHSSKHAENSFSFGKGLTMDGRLSSTNIKDVRNIMMIGFDFSANYAIHDENTPMILFGSGGSRPTLAMMPDPDEQGLPMNLMMGSTHVAYNSGTAYPLQPGIGSGCFILHGENNRTKAPTVNVPDAVTMYAGDRVDSNGNTAVGGKGLIIKGENSGRTYISERVGINVSHDSSTYAQINEDVEAGLHIFGEGNSNTTSAVKVENSDGNVAIEVLNDLVVVMPNLPTSSAGLPTGALYNDNGTVKVA